MIHVFSISFIPGIMLGLEWDYENYFVVLDLFIVRFVWDYYGYPRDEEVKEEE